MTIDNIHFEGASDYPGEYKNLARWLAHVLETPLSTSTEAAPLTLEDSQLNLFMENDYHLAFYRQLPDFIMVLLSNDSSSLLQYAPLMYHLAACRECHQQYLELYDALQFAVAPQGIRPTPGQGTRTLQATPPRMLGHLCQTLIRQAEAVLLQARHEHVDADNEARSLLQLAIRISAHISQHAIRRQSLQDLVRVATLFDGAPAAEQDRPDTYAYTPVLAGSGSRRGKKSPHGSQVLERSSELDQPAILIQSQGLEGRIEQQGKTLMLRLQGLGSNVCGQYVHIAVPVGSLLDPVRWSGGDPHAIPSSSPVDANGILETVLGETDLSLSNPEEHNMLEALFSRLEVKAIR